MQVLVRAPSPRRRQPRECVAVAPVARRPAGSAPSTPAKASAPGCPRTGVGVLRGEPGQVVAVRSHPGGSDGAVAVGGVQGQQFLRSAAAVDQPSSRMWWLVSTSPVFASVREPAGTGSAAAAARSNRCARSRPIDPGPLRRRLRPSSPRQVHLGPRQLDTSSTTTCTGRPVRRRARTRSAGSRAGRAAPAPRARSRSGRPRRPSRATSAPCRRPRPARRQRVEEHAVLQRGQRPDVVELRVRVALLEPLDLRPGSASTSVQVGRGEPAARRLGGGRAGHRGLAPRATARRTRRPRRAVSSRPGKRERAVEAPRRRPGRRCDGVDVERGRDAGASVGVRQAAAEPASSVRHPAARRVHRPRSRCRRHPAQVVEADLRPARLGQLRAPPG